MVDDTFEIGGEDEVHRLGFGAMSLAGSGNLGWTDDVEAARRVVERAVDSGVDFVDTADMYGNGSSELVVGEAVDASRDDLVVATKGGICKQPDGDTVLNGSPAYLKNAALRSRVRLRVDEIDLYQYHRPDPHVPFVESVRALAELRDDGVVRHVGLSNVTVDQLEAARDVVEVATVQNEYSLTNRDDEELLEYCESNGIGFVPYSPLDKADLDARAEALDEVAAAHDASRYQVALAWLLHRSPVLLPIPGTASVDHLEENLAAADIDLSDDELDRLA
ncbi:aldo/keto reductase [Candidatus Halobonum tyrrellensis]|uniref:Oxidoreductase n=1 Tax=Candidatus Halobonum tyrrellensis G22 TaxID=1324957 RepID=V4IUV4_9EURY|nr:aldo/keto reductase [Candidatus Halobonum tyrrellensis]ESP86982.1 oxidoreductase [Candidatus Halobonum tyrrellensis G22]